MRLLITGLLVGLGVAMMFLPRGLSFIRLWRNARRGPVAVGTGPVDSAQVVRALETVLDPELGVNIVELGLIDSLALDSLGNVFLRLILTTPFCPYAQPLAAASRLAIARLPGVRNVNVRLNLSASWSPVRLKPAGRQQNGRRFRP